MTGKNMIMAGVITVMILFSFSSGIAAFTQSQLVGKVRRMFFPRERNLKIFFPLIQTYTNPDRTAHEVELLSQILDVRKFRFTSLAPMSESETPKIWLFGTAATDAFISVVLAIALSREQKGFNHR